ncbi:MAG: phosphatidate cytidylyltransferase [Verrucomicrobiota bacterium]|nr:phosphatidate cytidylyltransferase [Verrucomicrobiota bacterium]
MRQRIFSFIALWAITGISLLFFGVHAGIFLITVISFFTQLELYQLFEKMGLRPIKSIGLIGGSVISLGAYYLPDLDAGNDLFLLIFLLLTLIIIRMDLQAGRLRSFMPTLFGLIYVPYLLHFLIKIVRLAEFSNYGSTTGIFLTIWIVAVAKSTDVGGFLVGTRIGKTPLSAISPKKTYEGATGGILFAVIVGLLLLSLFKSLLPEDFSWWLAIFIATLVAIASIASDLVESALKRQARVKDSGDVIPGIGGFFDLSDSLILTAPLAYLLFKYTVL